MIAGYLGGPIANCNDAEAKDWREYVTAKTLVRWHDPMVRDFRKFKVTNNTEEDSMSDKIVRHIIEGDKECIDDSDICLFNCWKASFGTPMEMIYAWEKGKTNLVVVPENVSLSPWIRYHATKIFRSVDDAVDYINESF